MFFFFFFFFFLVVLTTYMQLTWLAHAHQLIVDRASPSKMRSTTEEIPLCTPTMWWAVWDSNTPSLQLMEDQLAAAMAAQEA